MSDIRVDWATNGWRQNKYAHMISAPGYASFFGIDTDGMYGAQCKDFVNAYLDTFAHWIPAGNAIDIIHDSLPGSVERIMNPGANIQIGDVFVLNIGQLDHTGVVTSVVNDGFYSIDQNWFNANNVIGSPPAQVKHLFANIACVIRLIPGKGALDMLTNLDMEEKMAQVIAGRINRSGLPNNDGPDLAAHVGQDAGQEFLNWYWSTEARTFREQFLPHALDVYDKYKDLGPQLESENTALKTNNQNLTDANTKLAEQVTQLGGQVQKDEQQKTADTQLINDSGNIVSRWIARLFGH